MHIAHRLVPSLASLAVSGCDGSPGLLPCPVVQAVLERGITERRFLFPDAGPPRRVERWCPPAIHGPVEAAAVEQRLQVLDDVLQPAQRGALLARVLALLSHYRLDPHPPEVEQRLADDWAEDLGGYPLWAVEAAARAWRRTRRFKPQPVEMLALCEERCGALQRERDRLRQVAEGWASRRNPLSRDVAILARGLLQPMP